MVLTFRKIIKFWVLPFLWGLSSNKIKTDKLVPNNFIWFHSYMFRFIQVLVVPGFQFLRGPVKHFPANKQELLHLWKKRTILPFQWVRPLQYCQLNIEIFLRERYGWKIRKYQNQSFPIPIYLTQIICYFFIKKAKMFLKLHVIHRGRHVLNVKLSHEVMLIKLSGLGWISSRTAQSWWEIMTHIKVNPTAVLEWSFLLVQKQP